MLSHEPRSSQASCRSCMLAKICGSLVTHFSQLTGGAPQGAVLATCIRKKRAWWGYHLHALVTAACGLCGGQQGSQCHTGPTDMTRCAHQCGVHSFIHSNIQTFIHSFIHSNIHMRTLRICRRQSECTTSNQSAYFCVLLGLLGCAARQMYRQHTGAQKHCILRVAGGLEVPPPPFCLQFDFEMRALISASQARSSGVNNTACGS